MTTETGVAESIQLTSNEQENQVTPTNDANDGGNIDTTGTETEITPKEEEPPKCTKKTITIISIIAGIVLIIGIVLIVVLTTGSDDASDNDNNTQNDDNQTVVVNKTVISDIGLWGYNIILSKEIDSTGLEHGILYKQLNLTQQSSGLNRVTFNEMYIDDGPTEYTQAWLNAQSRTVYDYALAYEQTMDRTTVSSSDRMKFLLYAINGMEAIFQYFYDEMYGGYFRSIILYNNGTREIVQEFKDSYQHFFLIKALSKLYQVTYNETYLDKALEIYELAWNNFTDETGVGLYPTLTRDFSNSSDGVARNTDPLLHFFHSSQKLYEAVETYYDVNPVNGSETETRLEYMEERINMIYGFIMDVRVNVYIIDKYTNLPRNFNVVCLNYVYSPDDNKWIADPSIANQLDNTIVGHGFEFAFFIWRFMDYGVIAKTDQNVFNANEMFEWSVELSFNRATGALDFMYHVTLDTTLYWWHQTQWWVGIEAIRAITYYNVFYDNLGISDIYTNAYIAMVQNMTVNWFNEIFYDPTYGGIYHSGINQWRQKGFEWKVGYHTIEALLDVLNFIPYEY